MRYGSSKNEKKNFTAESAESAEKRQERQRREVFLRRGGTVWPIFLFFACLYLLSMGRGFYSSDGEVIFKTTAALVERGSFALQPDPGLPQIVQGAGGQFYSKYDPGLPLISIPFYVTGDWLGQINHAHRYRLASTAVLMVPALAGAGTLTLLGLIARRLVSARRALIVVLAAGLASPLWPYARMLFPEAILACALGGAVGCAIIGRERRGVWWAFAAGLCLGAGMLVRAAFVIYALPLGVLLVSKHAPFHGERESSPLSTKWGESLGEELAFGVGVLPFAAGLLLHNALRFGSPFETGYGGEGFSTPIPVGVFGLLFSPGKSVFLYAPPLILAVLLWPRFRRAYPALGAFLALAWVTALLFYGAWWAWYGGWCWGPRFLVPLIPISLLPLGMLPPGRRWRGSALALIGLGMGVQLLGVLTDVTPLYASVVGADESRYRLIHFVPRYSPLVGATRRVIHGQMEPLALFHLKETGLPPTWTIGVPLLLIAGLVVSGWRFVKKMRGRVC